MAIRYVTRPFTVTTSTGSTATLTQESGSTSDNRIIVVNTATDDGAGKFLGTLGTVDYGGKSASLKVVQFDRSTSSYKSDFEDAKEFATATTDGSGSSNANSKKGGEYGTASVGEEVLAGTSVVARYRVAPATAGAHDDIHAASNHV